jgi:hypothetical protein
MESSLRMADLDSWLGVRVIAIDTHSFLLTLPMVKTVTDSGVEIRVYSNKRGIVSCGGTGFLSYSNFNTFQACSAGLVGCDGIFYIRDGKVTLINHKVGNEKYFGYIEPQTQLLLEKLLPKIKASDTLFSIEMRQLQRRLQYIMNDLFNEGLDGKDPANRVVVHTLRHTFASHLVMKGVPLVKVKELMAHKDIATTMIYSHLAPDAGKEDVMNLWS